MQSAGNMHCLCTFLLQMHSNTISDLENVGQNNGAQYLHGAILSQISKAIKEITRFRVSFHHFQDMSISFFSFENLGKGRNDAIQWRISTSIQVIPCIYTPALTVFEILTIQLFDLENLVVVIHYITNISVI